MGRFLTALAGARREILDQCPTERLRFQSLGWAILITSGIATVSMWFALTSAMGINAFLSFFVAIIWGLVIMGIDRWLVTSIPPSGSRRLWVALPRLVLAVLLGSLISTPIVLRIFQSEINTQLAAIKQERASTFIVQQQKSSVSQQVAYWNNQVSNLDKVVNSGGQVPLNPSADPVIRSLTKQRTNEISLEQKYYQQWQCQLYGGTNCPAGNGPLAQASEQSYNTAKQQIVTIDGQISAREKALSASDANSEHTRYTQAVNALPNAKQELANATAQQDALRNNFENSNLATNGLLIRLQALNELSDKDFTVNAARFLIFLFFLVIECLPVTVKLLQRPGNYEEVLQATAERELKEAKRAIRVGLVSAMGQPGPTSDAVNTWTPAAARENRDGERDRVREIWQERQSVPDWQISAVTEPSADPGAEPGTRSRLDTALRDMRDTRRTTTPDGRGGELRYDADDL